MCLAGQNQKIYKAMWKEFLLRVLAILFMCLVIFIALWPFKLMSSDEGEYSVGIWVLSGVAYVCTVAFLPMSIPLFEKIEKRYLKE